MDKEVLGAIAYKNKKDYTLEDIDLIKENVEKNIESELRNFEEITGLKVNMIHVNLRDDLDNITIKLSVNI